MNEPERSPTSADLAKYLSGESTHEEANRVQRWIEADWERRSHLEGLRSAWDEASTLGPTWDVDRMWGKLSHRVHPPSVRSPTVQRPVMSPDRWFIRSRSSWLAIAAVLVLTIGVSSIWFFRSPAPDEVDVAQMREVVTTAGQRAEVRLGDGSRVILGVDSRLRFPVTLGPRARDLELFGQAYFEVQHDPDRPFRVRAGGVITEDLGTEFVIRAYGGDPGVRVAVASGQVTVRRDGRSTTPTTLSRGDLATVGDDGRAMVTPNADLEAYLAWTKGRIEFRRTPLAEAARDLSRWYGIEIRLGERALERLRLTGSFRNEPVAEVLHLVSASLSLRVERVGDVVTLWPK